MPDQPLVTQTKIDETWRSRPYLVYLISRGNELHKLFGYPHWTHAGGAGQPEWKVGRKVPMLSIGRMLHCDGRKRVQTGDPFSDSLLQGVSNFVYDQVANDLYHVFTLHPYLGYGNNLSAPRLYIQLFTGRDLPTMNIPLQSGMRSADYRTKFDEAVIPFIQKSNPDLIIISSGFDAHHRDPMASINLETDDFSYMIRKLKKIRPHLLVGLEGGYDLQALRECCEAVAGALINDVSEMEETLE